MIEQILNAVGYAPYSSRYLLNANKNNDSVDLSNFEINAIQNQQLNLAYIA